MKTAVEIFLLLVVFACGSLLTWCVLALRSAARRETRNTQERHDAMQRHPAGERLPANGCEGWNFDPRTIPAELAQPVRARCGAWVGASNEGYFDIQFKQMTHVLECQTCQLETQRRAA